MPGLLDKAIFAEWFRGFIIGLLVMLGILFVLQGPRTAGMLFEISPQPLELLSALLLLLPPYLSICIPAAHLVSCLTLVLRYKKDGEWRALNSLGLNRRRLVRPLLLCGLAMAVFVFILAAWLEPLAKVSLEKLVSRMAIKCASAQLRSGYFSELGNDISVYVGKRENDKLEKIFISDDRAGKERVLWAKEAIIQSKGRGIELQMNTGGILGGGKSKFKADFEKLNFTLPSLSGLKIQKIFKAEQLAMLGTLWKSERPENKMEAYRRLALPLALLLFGFLGIAIAGLPIPGAAGLAYPVSITVLGMYYLTSRLGYNLLKSVELAPELAALAPLVALSLLVFAAWMFAGRRT